MKNETRVFLQRALELMTSSVGSNEASSASMIVQVCSVFPCCFEIEIGRPDPGCALEVAIIGAGMRGARESLRFEDPAGFVETILSRMAFCFGNESSVSVRIMRNATDPSSYLPSYFGNTESGQLETMPEPVRIFVKDAVEQAVRALVQEECQTSELKIRRGEQTQPVCIRLETGNDGANTRTSNLLYVQLPPSQFCLKPNSNEVVAFVMGRLPADIAAADDRLEIELQKKNRTGFLPPIRLVKDEPQAKPMPSAESTEATVPDGAKAD